ncbi:hypothetical protein ATO12_05255 [Aquimarina atlantica]|uniref:Uncharacterized protein n=1 Tax=Aquimarina atlantica TaxID=1317122 RepID=A0A023BNX3_9FLAO|nr:hypothetical protein ATO12_05255 [Aquimarina atlantica]
MTEVGGQKLEEKNRSRRLEDGCYKSKTSYFGYPTSDKKFLLTLILRLKNKCSLRHQSSDFRFIKKK